MKMGDWVVKSCKTGLKAYIVLIRVWDAEALTTAVLKLSIPGETTA